MRYRMIVVGAIALVGWALNGGAVAAEDPSAMFLGAAKAGSLATVSEAVSQGADVNARNEQIGRAHV